MPTPMQRGLDRQHEQDPGQLLRDTRTTGQRIHDFFGNPTAISIILVMIGVSQFILPGLADIALISGVVVFLVAHFRRATLPFRLPEHCRLQDYNDTIPGSNKPRTSRGIYFFGNELKTNLELWFSNEDMRTHVLIFGSTGSGKTEGLISIAYNALLQASGFIYVDGKGDNTLFAKIFSMLRYMGRDDDLLLVNFMTGARDIIGPQKKRISNTMNPFARGSSSMLSQLVVSLMDKSAGSGDGDMWKGRAIGFVEAIMRVLVTMRDAGHILLDANVIRNYFVLDRLEAIVWDKSFPRDNGDPISLESLPDVVTEPVKNYIINLPGYNKAKRGKHVSQVLEQHGFITMQLTRVFTSLADTYGHILRTNLPEVDLPDVVLNRRVLLVLLPALEKSPDELANLGKVVIASLRAMMAAGLGDAVEGEYRDLIQRKPTNAATPYLCILDEYGYYAVEGFAVVPAQARSLGFSVIFAGQDLPAFQKASKEEALSIGANTNIKICMKLEDPTETWDFFMKTAGESYVTHVEGFSTDAKSVMNHYMDTRSAKVEKRQRVDLLDLKEQGLGEMHIFFKSKIVRAAIFYANPEPVPAMRLNHFLKVDVPPDKEVDKLRESFNKFPKTLSKGAALFSDVAPASGSIQAIISSLDKQQEDVSKGKSAIERGVASLLSYHEDGSEVGDVMPQAQILSDSELSIFTGMRNPEEKPDYLIADDLESFAKPLLSSGKVREHVEYVERMMGRSEQHAGDLSIELLKDLQIATHYPPAIHDKLSVDDVVEEIDDLIDDIYID